MPRAFLMFRLPEERDQHKMAVNAWKYRMVLSDLSNFLRSMTKYETLTEEQFAAYNSVRDKLYELINDEGIEI